MAVKGSAEATDSLEKEKGTPPRTARHKIAGRRQLERQPPLGRLARQRAGQLHRRAAAGGRGCARKEGRAWRLLLPLLLLLLLLLLPPGHLDVGEVLVRPIAILERKAAGQQLKALLRVVADGI
jgi:hypothetical protein